MTTLLVILLILGCAIILGSLISIIWDCSSKTIFALLYLGIFLAFCGGIPLVVQSNNHFINSCHAKSGHVKHLSHDTICISPDGRLLND